MPQKILFLDTTHPILSKRLTQKGFICEFDYQSSKEQIENKINQYFGVIIRSRIPIDDNFIDKAFRLKFIARSGAGLENIDVNYAQKKGIKVFNSPEGNMDAVGEHVLGMLLMLFNQLKKGNDEVRKGIWDREGNRGIELAGKTVGIIGYGNMGKAFAQKLQGFKCKVIAHDKYKKGFSSNLVEEVDLLTIFSNSDVVSIHLPLADDTYHYIDTSFIQQFKKPIYLINTARGNNVNTNDLVSALQSKEVLGACLDVLEFESKSFELNNKDNYPAFDYLKNAENVILSPHVAGWTVESYEKLATVLADKIEITFCKS